MREAMAAWASWVLISGGCIYGSPGKNALVLDDECRRVCSDAHASCVRGGVAKTFGLPGVTYDLCARELEDCQANCGSGGPTVAGDGGVEVVAAGVVWDEGASKLRCPLETSSLDVPRALHDAVRRVSEGEVQLALAPDGVLSMSAARGEATDPVSAWLLVHNALSALDPKTAKIDVHASARSDSAWSFDYAVVEGETTSRFRMVQRTVRRAGGYCRVIAVERAGVSRERSPAALLETFR